MFTQTWKIYLPVITILMKRAVSGEQTLKMNLTDFERAAGGRKIKFSFNNLVLTNGKINSLVQHTNLAKDLGMLLQEDEQTRKLLQKKEFRFSMTADIQLTIQDTTAPEEEDSVEVTTEGDDSSESENNSGSASSSD